MMIHVIRTHGVNVAIENLNNKIKSTKKQISVEIISALASNDCRKVVKQDSRRQQKNKKLNQIKMLVYRGRNALITEHVKNVCGRSSQQNMTKKSFRRHSERRVVYFFYKNNLFSTD